MSETNYEYDGYGHHHEAATFNDILVEQLRSVPWLMISVAVHVVIAIILNLFSSIGGEDDEDSSFNVSEDATLENEMEEEVEEETEEIKPEEEPTEEPVIKDTEISDHNETDDNEEWEESKGDEDNLSDKPFDGTQTNDAIGLGGGAGGRFGRNRGGKRNLRAMGGGGKTQRAVERGLEWLANHQSKDGRWDCDAFMQNGDPKKGELCDGKGNAMYDVGVSGLALLAFLGAGNTHKEGTYRTTVRKALKWLKNQQDAEGCFGSRGDPHFTYNHAIGALAMTEAYAMTRSGIWKATAQNGLNFVMKCQNPYKAWRYGECPGDNDSSVTGWMVMALKSAKVSGLDVNETALTWARDWIVEMTDEE
ncbi:MAG: terpene cyclase/mutase family protein, partial [Planctomycetes bacterium]|nr:terpene cyclase/mutase family protein [Planctomycetota bacterium]